MHPRTRYPEHSPAHDLCLCVLFTVADEALASCVAPLLKLAPLYLDKHHVRWKGKVCFPSAPDVLRKAVGDFRFW